MTRTTRQMTDTERVSWMILGTRQYDTTGDDTYSLWEQRNVDGLRVWTSGHGYHTVHLTDAQLRAAYDRAEMVLSEGNDDVRAEIAGLPGGADREGEVNEDDHLGQRARRLRAIRSHD